jgi:RimJ/RimL family protein N-acetyltransferase
MPLQPITQLLANRVAIRPVSGADLDDLFEINGDDAVTRFLPYATWRTAADASAWLERMEALAQAGGAQQLVVERNEDRKVIGTVLLFRFDEGSARWNSATPLAGPAGARATPARRCAPSATMPSASCRCAASRRRWIP